tara:strand:- start:34782 stop:35180 length:399 start_codon:yes stop_codon:yes gene_type:complete
MAIESDVQLKTYFEVNDFPTQVQFSSFIDSKYSKEAGMGVELGVLVDDEPIIIPSKRLFSKLIIWSPDVGTVVNLGDTVGGTQYLQAELLVQNVPRTFDIDIPFSLSSKTIYIQFDDGAGGGATGEVRYYIN